MGDVTITVDDKTLNILINEIELAMQGDPNLFSYHFKTSLIRFRKAIAFSKINHGKVLDDALTGTREEIQEKALR